MTNETPHAGVDAFINTYVATLNAEANRLGLEELDAEQRDALLNKHQAFAMLDDMEARCGMNVAEVRSGLVEHFGAAERAAQDASLYAYTPGEAISAIRARLGGVWDDPQLAKLGPLSTDSLVDVRRIVEGVGATYTPTPMEHMLAEALRAMVDRGAYYDDGDFIIEATEAEHDSDIKVVSDGFAAVRVYDEAMGQYGEDKLNPVIPDFSAKTYTYAEVMHRYRELLKENPGKGLIVDGHMVAVMDPELQRLYHGEHLGGPEVVDVRDLQVFAPFEGTVASSDRIIREIKNPVFVDLPQGFNPYVTATSSDDDPDTTEP